MPNQGRSQGYDAIREAWVPALPLPLILQEQSVCPPTMDSGIFWTLYVRRVLTQICERGFLLIEFVQIQWFSRDTWRMTTSNKMSNFSLCGTITKVPPKQFCVQIEGSVKCASKDYTWTGCKDGLVGNKVWSCVSPIIHSQSLTHHHVLVSAP